MSHAIVGALGAIEVFLLVAYWLVAPLTALAGALLYVRWERRRKAKPPINSA